MMSIINSGVKAKFDFNMRDSLLEELCKIATKQGYAYTKDEIKVLMKEFIKNKCTINKN